MRTVSFYTFGCRTNQAETETMAHSLSAFGWQNVPEGKESDVAVIQSCTVTGRADAKVRQTVRKIYSQFPKTAIVICGCIPPQNRTALESMPGVRRVLDNTEKANLTDFLKKEFNILQNPSETPELTAQYRTRATIKIQEGCDCFCTYCIVPYVRGAPRSVSFQEAFYRMQKALALGFREIVLTGTHLGKYECQGRTLEDLLEQANSFPGDFRIRLSSLEPLDITDRLVEMIALHPRLCPHLHLSLQSLSGSVLARMGRRYSPTEAANLICQIHKTAPHAQIGTDLIAGFPGETEFDFSETVKTLSDLPIHYGHIFRYSPRPGTPAAIFPDRASPDIAESRSRILRDLLSVKRKRFIESQKGKTLRVLVENAITREGLTENYLRVRIQTREPIASNRFYDITIGKECGRFISGKLAITPCGE